MDALKEISMTQTQLAKALGKNEVTIHRWRHDGTTPANKLKMLKAIKSHLELSLEKVYAEQKRIIEEEFTFSEK